MKILVFSDSHNCYQPMVDAATLHSDAAACFFLGDGVNDADALQAVFPKLPIYKVQGNCDFGSFDPMEGLVPIGGCLIFYTHGHTYSVKYNIGGLCQAAIRSGANIALYGHTHASTHDVYENIHLFNPGSISQSRSGSSSYGVIHIENATPRFEICFI